MSLIEFKTRKTVRRRDVIGPPTAKQDAWDRMSEPIGCTQRCRWCGCSCLPTGQHHWGWSGCKNYQHPGMRPLDDGTVQSRLIWTKKEDPTP